MDAAFAVGFRAGLVKAARTSSFTVTGSVLGRVYNAGRNKITKLDKGRLGERDAGWYGAGFYVDLDSAYVKRWYGPVVNAFDVSPGAKVLMASVDAAHAPSGLWEAVIAQTRDQLKARGVPGQMGHIESLLKSNQLEWVHAVDQLAERDRYDVVFFNEHEIVVKNMRVLMSVKSASLGSGAARERITKRVREFQAKLRPGDIVNTNPRRLDDIVSKIYKPISTAVQGTRFGHSAIYVGNGKIIEARIGEGVTEKPLVEAAAENQLVAVRPVGVSPKDRQAAVAYAKKNLGKAFSFAGLVTKGLTPNALAGARKKAREKLDAFFCSQLVANAWHKVPFHAERGVAFTRPVDILHSEHVEQVAKLSSLKKKKRRPYDYLRSGLLPFTSTGIVRGPMMHQEGPVPEREVQPAPSTAAPFSGGAG